MSLPLISEAAAEVHRLIIAGSALAAGDFRLQKLLPQLESLGAKAPIFTRIAQGVKAVTDESDAAKAGRALLDLSTLLTAIQYTQSQHDAEGEFTPINTAVQSWTPTVAGYRSLAAVVEALTSTGEGRLEIVRDAAERGLFKDLRLMQPAITALGDRFGELADFAAEKAIPQFGPVVVPLLKAGFDPKGGNPHARRLRALCAVDKEEGRAFCRTALEEAKKEVKAAAVAGLAGCAGDYDAIFRLTKDRAEEVRHAAIRALGQTPQQESTAELQNLFDGPDGEIAIATALGGSAEALPECVFVFASRILSPPPEIKDDDGWKQRRSRMLMMAVLQGCRERRDPRTVSLLEMLFLKRKELDSDLNAATAQLLYEMDSPRYDELLYAVPEELGPGQHVIAFMAAYRRVPPAELLRLFGAIFEKRGEKTGLNRLLRGWPIQLKIGDWREYPAWGRGLELAPEWLELAMKLESVPVVANLTRKGDLAAKALLISKERYHPDDQHELRSAIFRADPEGAADYVAGQIAAMQERRAQIYEVRWLVSRWAETVPVDPAALSAVAASLSGKYKKAFEEACAEISPRQEPE